MPLPTRFLHPVLLAAFPLAALVLPTPAIAAPPPPGPACLPPPAGVPGESGPPNWWDVTNGREDDPRWRGSSAVGHESDHGRFLGLYANDGGQDYLYLSWEIRADGGGTAEDYIYFGFVDPGTTTGVAFRITVPTDTGTGTVDKVPIQPSQVQMRSKNATGVAWSAFSVLSAGDAPWIENTGRYWVDCGAACDTYHVQVRVPISATATTTDVSTGVNVPDNFSFWYDMQVSNPGIPPTVVHHAFPEGEAFSVANFGNSGYPGAGDWREVQIKSTTGCETGVNLTGSQIFVTHATASPDTTINTDNTFHATPTNNTGGSLPGDAVRARFRIADWGSAGVGSSPQWNAVPNCDTATGSGSVGDGSTFDLTCDWNPDIDTLCDYRPTGVTTPPWDVCSSSGTPTPSKYPHQCILVDLSAGAGAVGNIFFNTASAYRNMNLRPASKLEEEAVISVEGLDPIPGQTERDVYLYVQTSNLPEKYVPPKDDPDGGDDGQNGDENEGGKKDGGKKDGGKDGGRLLPGAHVPAELQKQLAAGLIDHDELAEQVPTFLVHVWHDTGAEHEDENGDKRPVLAPQPSFGMYLHHEGDLQGWAWRLEAAGLEMIAPNYFRLPVAMGGTAKLKTIVQAVEEGEERVPPNELVEQKDPGKDPGQDPGEDPGKDPGDTKKPDTPEEKKGWCLCTATTEPQDGAAFFLFAAGVGLALRRRRRREGRA